MLGVGIPRAIVLGGFEPPSPESKSSMIDHYTIGLRGWSTRESLRRSCRVDRVGMIAHDIRNVLREWGLFMKAIVSND